MITLPDPTQTKSLATFRASIRAAVNGIWSGQTDLLDFIDQMYSTIRRGFEQAWREGAAECGLKPNERTPEEQAVLDGMIEANLGYVVRFGDYLEANTQASGARLQPALDRAELWVNRYNEVRARAQVMACSDRKLRWVWSPLKEHCGDCRKLNGRVYRDSIWRKYDIYPADTRPGKLQCHGFKCGCHFEETKDPVTPGRPPMTGRG